MHRLNRRTFVQLSTGALLTTASGQLLPSQVVSAGTPSVTSKDGLIRVQGPNYLWQYAPTDDRFTLLDSRHRLIVGGTMQPAVIVAPADDASQRICKPGKLISSQADQGRVVFIYEGVNTVSIPDPTQPVSPAVPPANSKASRRSAPPIPIEPPTVERSARITMTWRFDQNGIWIDPILYEATAPQDVVSLHYFLDNDGLSTNPTLHPTYLIVPGVVSGSTVSPILHNAVNLNQSFWLGRGSFIPGVTQQWALPVHYFCGFSAPSPGPERNLYTEYKSDAFTLGLAGLPSGDLYLQLNQGHASPWIDYRSDIWKQLRGPGKLTLGAAFLCAVAPDYYQSIAAYYQGLLHAGAIQRKHNTVDKTETALKPQFCTWGAQRTRGKANEKLDEAFLTGIYKELKASGMKAGLFSIDDKWEGAYGNLVHSAKRFPHFIEFLDQLRNDHMKIGMWAAIMRCEDPSALGLTLDQMLKQPDGAPFVTRGAGDAKYYILDFTQPEVAKALTDLVIGFMRRYKPDLFKFDFGYELPAIATAAPANKQWSGERLMWKGLEVVVKAMRSENPNIVVMYYNLSPLFLDFIDLHSSDDLYLDIGDYEVEANRRFYFSSLMGQLGVPTYGSSGYDWSSSPSIWFDSAAIGSIGSLNDFAGDERGEVSTPEIIARYNGITHVLRQSATFEILPIGGIQYAPTSGAHAHSWARFEDGQLVLFARRPIIANGEDQRLTNQHIDPRIKGVLHSASPVIVASKTNEAITRSNNLAIVSYGGGEIVLHRDQGTQAQIIAHYFSGVTAHSAVTIFNSQLVLTVNINHNPTDPLEWIEVRVS